VRFILNKLEEKIDVFISLNFGLYEKKDFFKLISFSYFKQIEEK
jgi:hypothetical protein